MYVISIILAVFIAITGIQATPYPNEALAFRHKHHKHHKDLKPENETVSFAVHKVIDSLNAIDSNMLRLNKTINKLNSAHHLRNPYHLVMLAHINNHLRMSVNRAWGNCLKADNFTKFESDRVVGSLMRMVPHGTSLMNNLEAHKPEFDKAILGVGSISRIIAKRLRQAIPESERLSRQLTAKLIPEYAVLAPNMTAKMIQHYYRVIEVFEKPSNTSEKTGPKFEMPDLSEASDMLRWKFRELMGRLKNFLHRKGHKLRHGHDENEIERYQSIGNSTVPDQDDDSADSTDLDQIDMPEEPVEESAAPSVI